MLKTPPLQTATATIDTLSGRLQSATLLEDRRAAILGLRSFAKQYPASVASGALRELINTLKRDGVGSHDEDGHAEPEGSGGDVDTIRLVLETLLMLFSPDATSPEAGEEIALFLADEFSMRQDNIVMLLSLLDPTSPHADYYSRLYSLQILSAICAARPDRLQECILAEPLGVSRLVGVLDDGRDAVRNAGLLLLVDLTSGANEELRKIVAFEEIFAKTFALIQMEGGLGEAGITAQDCLTLLANLLKGSASNQSMFRESGCVAQVVQLLQQAFPSENEADFVKQGREKAAWGLLQLIRLFLIPGESGTPQNQAALFRAGTSQVLSDLAFTAAFPIPIRASALRATAALIQHHPPLQEAFAPLSVITPSDAEHNAAEARKHANTNGAASNGRGKGSTRTSVENQRTYVLEALLELALDQREEEELLREAACNLIQAYLAGHDKIQAHFLQRAIAGHAEGETTANVLVTLLHPPNNDITGVVHASWIMQDLINENIDAKSALAAVQEGNEDEGEDVMTAIHGFGSQLQNALQVPIHARLAATYSSLLSTLLWDFAPGIDNLLEEGSSLIQTLVALIKTPSDAIATGLAAVLLGIVYEFSTKDSPIPRKTLANLVQQKLGRTKYLDALLQLRRQPAIRDFDLDAEMDQAGDGILSRAFVDIFTVEYARLRRAIDKDPGIEVLPLGAAEAGVDRDVLDDLRQQIQAAKTAQSQALQEAVEANQNADQARTSVEKEIHTATSEIERLRKINTAMQQGHESEIDKVMKQHEQEKNTLSTRHQHAVNTAKQEVERQAHATLREREATSLQKIQQLERRLAELGNEHRKEASGHANAKQQLEVFTTKQNELIKRERDLVRELDGMRQQHAALERRLQAAQEQSKAAESKLEVARKSLDSSGEEVGKLTAQIAELKADVRSRDEELKVERSGYAELEKELDAAKSAAFDAATAERADLDAAQSKTAELEKKLEGAAAAAVAAEIAERENLRAVETKVSALESELEDVKSAHSAVADSSKEELTIAQSKAAELEKELQTAKKELEDTTNAIKKSSADQKEKLEAAEKRSTDAEAKTKTLEKQEIDAATKLKAAEKKATDSEAKAKDNHKKLQAAEEKVIAAEKKASDSVKAASRVKSTLSKEDKDKIAKVDKLEDELEAAKKAAADAEKQTAESNEELQAARAAILEAEQATEIAKKEAEDALKSLATASEETNTANGELQAAQEAAAEAKQAAEKAWKETEVAKKVMETAKAKQGPSEEDKSILAKAQDDLEVARAEVDTLRKSLAQSQTDNEKAKAVLESDVNAAKASEHAAKADGVKLKEMEGDLKNARDAEQAATAEVERLKKSLETELKTAKDSENAAKEELESMLLVMGDIEGKRDEYKSKVKQLGGDVTDEDEDSDDEGEEEEDSELD